MRYDIPAASVIVLRVQPELPLWEIELVMGHQIGLYAMRQEKQVRSELIPVCKARRIVITVYFITSVYVNRLILHPGQTSIGVTSIVIGRTAVHARKKPQRTVLIRLGCGLNILATVITVLGLIRLC